jgi:hypothetical protein
MTPSGNWELLENFDKMSSAMTYDVSGLPSADEDENAIYHHFKVVVRNVSNVQSVGEKIVTVTL